MKIGNIEGTSDELRELIRISGFKEELYLPVKNKYTYIFIIIILLLILKKIVWVNNRCKNYYQNFIFVLKLIWYLQRWEIN